MCWTKMDHLCFPVFLSQLRSQFYLLPMRNYFTPVIPRMDRWCAKKIRGEQRADKKRRLRAIWYILFLPTKNSIWGYGLPDEDPDTLSVSVFRRTFLWNGESVIRWRRRSCRKEAYPLPRIRFRVIFIGEATMKDGWIWNARGCTKEGTLVPKEA